MRLVMKYFIIFVLNVQISDTNTCLEEIVTEWENFKL